MRLLDKVAQSAGPTIIETVRDGHTWRLPGADTLADGLQQCPLRYVLHDEVTAVCAQLAFATNTVLSSSIGLLRVPAPRLWLEFVAIAGSKTSIDRDCVDSETNACPRQRVGLLVTCDERGRKGSIDTCWESEDGHQPDLAPFAVEFDFDDELFSRRSYATSDGISLGMTIGNRRDLDGLFNCVRFKLHPEWHRYYRSRSISEIAFRQSLQDALNPLLGDIPFLATFCLLLISKDALHAQPCDRSGINGARARKGRPLLLDHVELTMSLGEAAHTGRQIDADRSGPRLHFVRGHLVRRQDAIFWRTSHMRGKPEIGSIKTRTVSLRMAGAGS
jgi:hypothetical protein